MNLELKPKKATHLLARLSFLVMALTIADVHAYECNLMQFQKNKSQGTNVRDNLCQTDEMVSVGSAFEVPPGGRLWLKASAAGSDDFQLICQNRAVRKVTVQFSSPFLPWITPKGLGQCSTWVDNKLSCADKRGTKNSFFCAIAVVNPPEYLKVTTLERTTSVKMRTVLNNTQKMEAVTEPVPEIIEAVVIFIRSEVGLCRSLYQVDQALKASWTLDVLGRIEQLSLLNSHRFEQEFLGCVESVINDFEYPKFTERVNFSPKL